MHPIKVHPITAHASPACIPRAHLHVATQLIRELVDEGVIMVPFPLGLGSAHAPRVARAQELDESPMVNRRALHGEVKNHQVRLLSQGGALSERQSEANRRCNQKMQSRGKKRRTEDAIRRCNQKMQSEDAIRRCNQKMRTEDAIKRQVTALACSACTTKNLARYAYQSEPKSELPPISSLMSSCNGFP